MDADIKPELIPQVLETFKQLREADETIYLRAASINIMNGFVGLNFSCDGSHYMHAKEFINKDIRFWFGETSLSMNQNSPQSMCHICQE